MISVDDVENTLWMRIYWRKCRTNEDEEEIGQTILFNLQPAKSYQLKKNQNQNKINEKLDFFHAFFFVCRVLNIY